MGMISSTYLLSQIFVIIAIVSLGISYLCKDKQTVLILCIVYAVFYGGQYLLLGATTGAAMNAVSIIRNVWFFRNARAHRKNDTRVFLVLCLTAAAFTVLTFDGVISLVPLCATILFTYSIWQDNLRAYKLLALPTSACWIFYNVWVGSALGLAAELCLVSFEIAGVMRMRSQKEGRPPNSF